MTKNIKTIGIVGGGTAGYLTALTLKKYSPEFNVTLIESSEVPIIGIGEATVQSIPKFFHETLGFDVAEFFKEVRPTIKMGIKFKWGLPGDYFFNQAFSPCDPEAAIATAGDINAGSLASCLMGSNKTFLYQSVLSGEQQPLIRPAGEKTYYAYHLDNRLLIKYLHKKVMESGVVIIDRKIDRVFRSEHENAIEALQTSDNEKFSYDLYFDCSGFRSLLLEQALKSNFIDYRDSLFCDRALACSLPKEGDRAYSTATTMPSGWLWDIPLRDSDNIGYVYSSDFCTDLEAENTLDQRFSGISNSRVIKFKTGRHEHCCLGNVVAVGNAYGFVEPLQSTGIHMIIRTIKQVAEPLRKGFLTEDDKANINSALNEKWDHIRWFLSMHFKFNKRLDTDFWQECRSQVDVSGYKDILELYKSNGPLKFSSERIKEMTRIRLDKANIGRCGIDLMMMGQGEVCNSIMTGSKKERFKGMRQKQAIWKQLVQNSLTHKEALAAIERQPELLGFSY